MRAKIADRRLRTRALRGVGALALLVLLTGCTHTKLIPGAPDLTQRLKRGARIACVGDFVVLRPQATGPAVSIADSLCQGREYQSAIAAALKAKGYAPTDAGIADVNWLFQDGSSVRFVEDSEIRVRAMRICPIFAWGDWVSFDTKIEPQEGVVPLELHDVCKSTAVTAAVVREAVRGIDQNMIDTERLLKKTEGADDAHGDFWEQDLPALRTLAQAYSDHDFVLLMWGQGHAVTNWQSIKSINWTSVVLQAGLTAAASGGASAAAFWRVKVCGVLMKAALIDVATGKVLWANTGLIDKHGQGGPMYYACGPYTRKPKFASKLLRTLPAVAR